MKLGNKVLYNGEEYRIVWLYSNGYCEIEKNDEVILVEIDQLQKI